MAASTDTDANRGSPKSTRLNWVLAILTVPAALVVVAFAYVSVLGSAGCTGAACDDVGPSKTVFGLILYGTPAVAVVAVVLSFVTARRRRGMVVPAVAWIAVIVAALVLVTTF